MWLWIVVYGFGLRLPWALSAVEVAVDAENM